MRASMRKARNTKITPLRRPDGGWDTPRGGPGIPAPGNGEPAAQPSGSWKLIIRRTANRSVQLPKYVSQNVF